jgi:predicted DNA-binding transcriptional regulator AlpA
MNPNAVNERGTIAAVPSQNIARLIPIEEVMARCAKGRTGIYAGIKAGTFPAPVKAGTSSRWLSGEIDDWIAALAASRSSAGMQTRRQ